MVMLHPADYPHIAEQIVSYMDRRTLITARAVEPTLGGFADKVLVEECERLWIGNCDGKIVFASAKGVLPHFHPASPHQELQRAVMRRVRFLQIGYGVRASNRLNSLLAELPPHAIVEIKHSPHSNSRHVLPKVHLLKLQVHAACRCRRAVHAPFCHQATRIQLGICGQLAPGATTSCGLVRGLLRQGVHLLHVRGMTNGVGNRDRLTRKLLVLDGDLAAVNVHDELYRRGVREIMWVLHSDMSPTNASAPAAGSVGTTAGPTGTAAATGGTAPAPPTSSTALVPSTASVASTPTAAPALSPTPALPFPAVAPAAAAGSIASLGVGTAAHIASHGFSSAVPAVAPTTSPNDNIVPTAANTASAGAIYAANIAQAAVSAGISSVSIIITEVHRAGSDDEDGPN